MYKLANRFYFKPLWVLVFFHCSFAMNAQDTTLNKYGLWVIDNIATYKKSIFQKPQLAMADLKKAVPGIMLDLRYASPNNFTHRPLYQHASTSYMRKAATDALFRVQRELKKQGMGLKIFDAYRPYAATELMWELVKDDRYAADPAKGSGHNRGIAVDLTIINLKTKMELNMGTGFDNFTDSAHHDFTALPADVLQNRTLLKSLMEKHGFKALDTEWWHYALPDGKQYPLLNIGFDKWKKL